MRSLWERRDITSGLEGALERALGGRGSVALVVAEAGLGKSALLDQVSDVAGACALGRAIGRDMEAAVPFGVFAQLLRSLGPSEALETIVDVDGPVHDLTTPYFRVARWIEGMSDRPTVLVVDDLHWADADSLRLLGYLGRRIDALPILFVAALRPWPPEAMEVADGLVGEGHAVIYQPGPLSRAASDEVLVAAAGDAVGEADRTAAWDLCRGNPLLLEQVGLHLAVGGGVPSASGDVSVAEAVVLTRFAGMDRVGLDLIRAASVLGGTFRPEVAAAVAGLTPAEAGVALRALTRSRLVVDVSGGLSFAHPLFAQAAYHQLVSPSERRLLHARCFEELFARGLRSEAVAHAQAAELVGDDRATTALAEEGRIALAAGAVAVAVRLFEAAVACSGAHCPPSLRLSLADALAAAGRVDEAAELVRTLLRDGDLDWNRRSEALRLLGRSSYLIGEIDHGAAAFREAVDLALAEDPVLAVHALLDESLVAWLVGGPSRALPLAAEARALAATGDAALRAQADATWGHVALDAGDPAGLDATAPILRRVLDPRVDHPFDAAELTWPWALAPLLANNAMHAEQLDEAHRAFALALGAAEAAGTANALATLYVYQANLDIRRGDLQGARHCAERGEDLVELTPGVFEYLALVRAEALLWSGRFAECEEACRLVDPIVDQQWFARFWLGHVRGCRLLWEGDPAASDHFLVVEETARAVGVGEPCLMHWGAHAVAAHVLAGRVTDGARVVAWLEEHGEPLTCRWPRYAAAVGRGHLAEHRGDVTMAEDSFAEALAWIEPVGLPLQHIEALVTLGGYLRRRGRVVDARPHLAAAAERAETFGAAWWAEAARSELALAGGRRRRANRDSLDLTPAERRVADEARTGHSNRQIADTLHISVNTVETHLKRVFVKLGVRTRRELMVQIVDDEPT